MQRLEVHRYEFGDFSLEPGRRLLLRHGNPIPLTPKALDTLLLLVRYKGKIVSKETLLNEIWPDAFVEEATLSQNIFTVRRALGQRPDGYQFIETIPKHGYRFIAPLREINDNNEIILEEHTRVQIFSVEFGGDFQDSAFRQPAKWEMKPNNEERSIEPVRSTALPSLGISPDAPDSLSYWQFCSSLSRSESDSALDRCAARNVVMHSFKLQP